MIFAIHEGAHYFMSFEYEISRSPYILSVEKYCLGFLPQVHLQESRKEKKKETNNSSLVVLRYNHCKWIKRYILFSTHKIPVAPAVPAVSLVPPAFPVSMPVPPPGFSPIPPPPFLRASFNPSQPPPGKKLSSYYFNSIQNAI